MQTPADTSIKASPHKFITRQCAIVTLSRDPGVLPDRARTQDWFHRAAVDHIGKLASPRKLIRRPMGPGGVTAGQRLDDCTV